MTRLIPALLLAGLPALPLSAAPAFMPPEIVADTGENLRFSRNPNNQAAFDSQGVLHLTYWVGGEETNVMSPSSVRHRSWSPSPGWSDEVIIDDSHTTGGQRLGGRNPSLAIRPNDDVWLFWHDHRHTSDGTGNSIDNIEIYADYLPSGADEFVGNIRLTETSAPHNGDNGYAPHPATGPDGRLHVAWYDFNDLPEVGDVYYRFSGVDGQFPEGETLADHRVTHRADREPSPASYTLPAVAVDVDGSVHLAWMEGTGGASPLRHAVLTGAATPLDGAVLSPFQGSFFDPPRLIPSPLGGVWLGYTERGTHPGGDVTLRHFPAGGGAFGDPISITNSSATQRQGSIRVDQEGIVHAAWIDERAGVHVYYNTWDPDSATAGEEVRLTLDSGTWGRPCLALDVAGRPHVLFEEDLGTGAGRIWLVRPEIVTAADPSLWMGYR